jgi:hypothetical protein
MNSLLVTSRDIAGPAFEGPEFQPNVISLKTSAKGPASRSSKSAELRFRLGCCDRASIHRPPPGRAKRRTIREPSALAGHSGLTVPFGSAAEKVTAGTGYPFDSGRPNRLWFGLFPFDGRVHNLSVSCGFGCDGVLHQAVEEFASATRFAAVEAEREFV